MTTDNVSTDSQAFRLRVPRSEYEALKVLSTAVGRSMNELIVTAVRDLLAAQRPEELAAHFDEVKAQYETALDKLAHL